MLTAEADKVQIVAFLVTGSTGNLSPRLKNTSTVDELLYGPVTLQVPPDLPDDDTLVALVGNDILISFLNPANCFGPRYLQLQLNYVRPPSDLVADHPHGLPRGIFHLPREAIRSTASVL